MKTKKITMDVPKTYTPTPSLGVYCNTIDKCYYYITECTHFNTKRYSMIDSTVTAIHHIYLLSNTTTAQLRYSLSSNPVTLKEFYQSHTINESVMLNIAHELLDNMSILHSAGVYHGNLSLTTIFISQENMQLSLVDFLFPKTITHNDPIIPSIQLDTNQTATVSYFQHDVASVAAVLLSPFYPNTPFDSIVNYFLTSPSSRAKLRQTSLLLDNFINDYLHSPEPFKVAMKYIKPSFDDIRYFFQHNTTLAVSYFCHLKYSKPTNSQSTAFISTHLPLTLTPSIDPHISLEAYTTTSLRRCTVQSATIKPAIYSAGGELYCILPKKKHYPYYSTVYAQMLFLLFYPSKDLEHLCLTNVHYSLLTNEQYQPPLDQGTVRFACSPFRIGLPLDLRKQFIAHPVHILLLPFMPTQNNLTVLQQVSMKLRSFGIIVECHTSVDALPDIVPTSKRVVIITSINREVHGLIPKIARKKEDIRHVVNNQLSGLVQTRHSFKDLLNMVHALFKKSLAPSSLPPSPWNSNDECYVFNDFKKLLTLLDNSQNMTPFESILTKRWLKGTSAFLKKQGHPSL